MSLAAGLAATGFFLPGWAVYLSVILPHEHVAQNWDVAWVGFDLGLALLAALAPGLAAAQAGGDGQVQAALQAAEAGQPATRP